jgi:hypothetical protein
VGKGKPKKTFDRSGKETNKEAALRKELKEKERQIKKLQSDIATLEAAFKKTAVYMSDKSQNHSVESLIEAANKHTPLAEIPKRVPEKKKIAPPSQEELEQKRKETIEKVQKWREQNIGKYEEE